MNKSILDKKSPSILEIEERMSNPDVRGWLDTDGTYREALQIPVSHGEVLDRLTILELKVTYIKDEKKLKDVNRELEFVERIWRDNVVAEDKLDKLYVELKEVNEELWGVEEQIRALLSERRTAHLARDVIRLNDLRSAIRQNVNELLGSVIVETKSY